MAKGLNDANVGNRQRLGDLVEVHRGLVTGANDYFVLSPEREIALGIMPWCVPVISHGVEILESDGVIRAGPGRKVVLRVPRDVDRKEFPALDAYLRLGETPAGDPRGPWRAVTYRVIGGPGGTWVARNRHRSLLRIWPDKHLSLH
jgi:hypothetical protein